MYRVVSCLTTQHDYRLVALAAVICASAAAATFKIYAQVSTSTGPRRCILLGLAGVCAGAGIWATHFVAMLAYDPGIPAGYEPATTAASFLIAVLTAIGGLAIARAHLAYAPALGGAVLGAGVASMHYLGMAALMVPGTMQWETAHVAVSLVLGAGLAAAALMTHDRSKHAHAFWHATVLLVLAICSLHFTAMGALTIVPDPTIVVTAAQIGPVAMISAVAGVTFLIMLSGVTATAVMENQTRRQREIELEQSNQLLDERSSRLQAIVDNFPGGITFLDADLRMPVTNNRAKQLLDLPDHLFADGPPRLEDVFRFNAERGEYGPGNVDEQVATRMALAKAAQSHAFERVRPDGTVIEVRGVPLKNGGFVTTYLDMTERRRNEAKIAHMAHHDALTDLPNRALLQLRLEEALGRATRLEGKLAVLMLDLDGFKEINDTLGHAVGDTLLKSVADRLRTLTRAGTCVARLGGDEFAIIMEVTDAPVEAAALAERILEGLSAPYDLAEHRVVVGTSIGIALVPDDGSTCDQVLSRADLALYGAKGSGRGTYRFFEAAMDTRMRARRALEADLRGALPKGEFELYYQPIMDINSGTISGCEALLCWHHPERGMILPGEFIALAEDIGLIVPIGEWVVRAACAEAATWPDHLKISVNVSPIQFKNTNLVPMVVNALSASGLVPGRLELEVTESALLDNNPATLEAVDRLRDLGVRISMDDFGTGYSSLANVQSFPFDKIKIDRMFISNAAHQANGLAVLKAIVKLASSLGVTTVVEGIETHDQLEQIRAEDCSEAQGFLFSPARPAAEMKLLFMPAVSLNSAA